MNIYLFDVPEKITMEIIKNRPIFLLFSIFIVSIILVNPIGDFPINDDFQYAYPVKSLLEKGEFELVEQFAPNIFSQVAWGYIVCWIGGGFSFTLLRFSTLFIAFLGLYFFYKILLELKVSKSVAFWGTLLLWFQPMYFNLSFSFMTDVPFVSLCLATFYFYLLHQKRAENKYRWIGHLLALTTFMLRQPGLLLFLSYEFILLIFGKKDKRATLSFLVAFLVAVGFYIGVEKGLKPYLDVQEHYLSVGTMYLELILSNPLFFCFQIIKRLFLSLLYMGLFTLPLAGFIWQKAKEQTWTTPSKLSAIVGFNILIMMGFGYLGYTYPYSGNMMYNLGLGAILLPDTFSNSMTYWLSEKPEIPFSILVVFGLICQINACYLVVYLLGNKHIQNVRTLLLSKVNQWFLVLGLFCTLYLVSVSAISFFDRYLLLPLTCLFIFLFKKIELKYLQKKLFYGLLSLFVFYSIAGTKDYLNILKTAHQAFLDLRQQNIPALQIDTDMAVNGFYEVPLRNKKADYKITMGILPDHEVIAEYPYFRYLHFKKDSLFILKK